MAEHKGPLVGNCESVQGYCPFLEIGCSETKFMSPNEMQHHLQKHMVPHTSLLIIFVLNVSRDVESLLYSTPWLVFRNPNVVADYENVISDIITRLQSVVGEHRELREAVRQQSERITILERRMTTMGISAGSPAPLSDEASVSGLPANELTHRVTNMENRIADHEVLLAENNRNVDDIRQQVNSLARQFEAAQETTRRLERKVESHEHMLANI